MLGERIGALRRARGLSQAELAGRLGADVVIGFDAHDPAHLLKILTSLLPCVSED